MTTETIAAIASGLTHAGIGIIRISGPDALQVGDRVVTLKNGESHRSGSHPYGALRTGS